MSKTTSRICKRRWKTQEKEKKNKQKYKTTLCRKRKCVCVCVCVCMYVCMYVCMCFFFFFLFLFFFFSIRPFLKFVSPHSPPVFSKKRWAWAATTRCLHSHQAGCTLRRAFWAIAIPSEFFFFWGIIFLC